MVPLLKLNQEDGDPSDYKAWRFITPQSNAPATPLISGNILNDKYIQLKLVAVLLTTRQR